MEVFSDIFFVFFSEEKSDEASKQYKIKNNGSTEKTTKILLALNKENANSRYYFFF